MVKAWSHLPNAHHIDWVLASLKENPEFWSAAWGAARDAARAAAWDAAWSATWSAARDATWSATWSAARDAAWSAAKGASWASARYAVRDAAWAAARESAWHSIIVLIAYDDCDQFLNMPYEKLRVWSVLSEDPRAILLLPMIYVREKLNEQCLVTSA